ncbi:MAG: RNA polymerase sigma factor [Clostridiales bacterium]|nr:RNA polymerase sigma factor [Clostridiales bacterium]
MEFEKIYKLYFKDVYIFLYSLSQNKAVAEDITQDTFLKAMKNIHTFDGRKEIKAWLFTIALT